jgi:hypothetical protein
VKLLVNLRTVLLFYYLSLQVQQRKVRGRIQVLQLPVLVLNERVVRALKRLNVIQMHQNDQQIHSFNSFKSNVQLLRSDLVYNKILEKLNPQNRS